MPLRPTLSALLAGVLTTLLLAAAPPVAAQLNLLSQPPGPPVALRHAGKCLAADAASADGLQLEPCNAGTGQAWRVEAGRVLHVSSGRCLANDGPAAASAAVRLSACEGGATQLWRVTEGRVVAQIDGLCLTGTAADPGGRLRKMDCRRIDQQLWLSNALERATAVRDVEAGPIFNQREAQQRCPAVCAPAAWTGRWVTTVQNKMSVCGCSAEGLAGALGGLQAGVASLAGAIDEASFALLMRDVNAEAFSSGRFRLLEASAGTNRFTAA